MRLEQQVCSLDLAKRLKELGVKQESAFYWQDPYQPDFKEVSGKDRFVLNRVVMPHYNGSPTIAYSAFTVAELGEMSKGYHLPEWSPKDKWHNGQQNRGNYTANTEADARAKMLIHLIEKGIVKP